MDHRIAAGDDRPEGAAVGISALVTADARIPQTLTTIGRLVDCRPAPAEILVHVDGNQAACADAIRRAYPHVRIILNPERVGPGGGRTALMAAVSHPIAASFDDDSYPIDADYFARAEAVMAQHPDAAVVCAGVYHQGERIEPDALTASWVADFVGCGCLYRTSAFKQTTGYVPIPIAYGMEESDLALRLHAGGHRLLYTPWLRVFHDTDRSRHAAPAVTAASIRNLALLTYLRYPATHWPIGVGQCFNRIQWLLRNGRRRGVLEGLGGIPRHLWKYRRFRRAVSAPQLRSYLRLRQHPVPADLDQRAP